MRIPDRTQAEALLREAGALNPGPWVEHSRHVAEAARLIAPYLFPLDSQVAYVLGLMHDIGRRAGVTGMRHVLDGYRYLSALGYADAARISMTHSFPNRDVREVFGERDCTPEELAFVGDYLARVDYTDYDRLIQLCDALATADGFVLMEKRMLDVAFRYGINAYSLPKWRTTFGIRADFEQRMGRSIYTLLPGIVEATFGVPVAELGLSPSDP